MFQWAETQVVEFLKFGAQRYSTLFLKGNEVFLHTPYAETPKTEFLRFPCAEIPIVEFLRFPCAAILHRASRFLMHPVRRNAKKRNSEVPVRRN